LAHIKWLYATHITPLSIGEPLPTCASISPSPYESLTTGALLPTPTTGSPIANAQHDSKRLRIGDESPPSSALHSAYAQFGEQSYLHNERNRTRQGSGERGGGNRSGDRGGRGGSNRGRGGAHHNAAPPRIDKCWFCLDSPDIEEHLVVSIGDEAYLALPKGALVPTHVLIIPIEHITNLAQATPQLLREIQQHKQALRAMAEAQGHEIVIYERNAPTKFGPVHVHLQVIPLPKETAAGYGQLLVWLSGCYHCWHGWLIACVAL
jgi:diadenosine tetraphosphate (Ap4A) HIT family hydrolase